MKRRSFFQVLTAFTAACLLPPIRAAQAVRSRVKHIPRWLTGRKHWEHLEQPIPAPNYIMGAPDAKIVCRVLGPTHFHTNMHPDSGGFEAALEEAGWTPQQIERRLKVGFGNWGMSVPCEACTLKIWIPKSGKVSVPGWQVEHTEMGWSVRCPDHRLQA